MGKLLVIKDADFSDVAVTRVTPVNPDSGGDDSGEWKQIAPPEMLTYNDYISAAHANCMFGTKDMIFNGSDNYTKASITFTYTETVDLSVYLIKLPAAENYENYTSYYEFDASTHIIQSYTFSAIADTEVTQEYVIPALEESEQYMFAVMSTNVHINIARMSNRTELGLETMTLHVFTENDIVQIESYITDIGNGTFVYSYFQIRYK